MSLKGKPVCAQNLFGNLLRDPRETQPDLTLGTSQLPWTILWGEVFLGSQFPHPQDCGMRSLSRAPVQLWVWRCSLEGTNANSGAS